jgi:hypothetical protein
MNSSVTRTERLAFWNRIEVGLAVEVGFVAPLFDQHVGLLLFLPLALDELEDVAVPDLQRLHLGCPAGLAARFHDGRDLVVDAHEGQRT